jgi:hypothetical protein
MAAGRQVTDATYRLMVRQDTSRGKHEGTAAADLLWDIRKAFENVDREILWEKGKNNGYPLDVLRLSLASYDWERMLSMGMLVSRPIKPSRGIAAGSAFATFELTLYLLDLMRDHKKACPEVTLSVHVDDFSQSAIASTEDEVVDRLKQSTDNVLTALKALNMPLAEDKGQIVATTPGLAGSITDQAKRLGVDYAISSKGKKRAKVAKHRMANARARIKILRKLRKHGEGPKIFFAGIKPGAMYGIELYEPHHKAVTELDAGAAASIALRPIGVSHFLTLMSVQTASLPGYLAVAAPIMRLAREIWTTVGTQEHTEAQGDALTPKELVDLWWEIQKAPGNTHHMEQGPIRALEAALKKLRWTLTGPTSITTYEGTKLDLTVGTPAMLQHYLVEAYETIQNLKAQQYLEKRELLPDDCSIDWNRVRTILKNRKVKVKVKNTLLQLLCGTPPTRAWLNKHGFKVACHCPCGEVDSCDHRLAGCNSNNSNSTRHTLLETLHQQDAPEAVYRAEGVHYEIDGQAVEKAAFQWEPDREVYTDGSCKYIEDKRLTIAAAAAVQIGKTGTIRSATVSLPFDHPRSAVVAEHVAIVVATSVVTTHDAITVVSDCQAVVQGAAMSMKNRLQSRRKMGGFWNSVGTKVRHIIKVKAHMTKEQAVSRGEEAHFSGNDLADKMANSALPVYNAEQLQAHFNREKANNTRLHEGLEKLQQAQELCPDMFTFEKDKGNMRYGYRPNLKHDYRWSEQFQKWVCINCAKVRRQGKGKASDRCSHSCRIMVEAHPSHYMHRMLCDRSHIPLIFCWKCGCYAQVRSEGLKNVCKRIAYHSTIRTRLRQAKHPRTKEGLHGMTKVLCLAQMQAQWPSVYGGCHEDQDGPAHEAEPGLNCDADTHPAFDQASRYQAAGFYQAQDEEDPEVDAFFDLPWGLD